MLKKIIVTTLFLPVLAIAIVFALLSQVDPNDYREDLAAIVHQETGGLLQIGGDIELGLFPSLEFSLGETRFTPKGENRPLLQIKKIDLGVGLLPMLTGRVEVSRIHVDGIAVYVAINEQGEGNWETLMESSGESTEMGDDSSVDSEPTDKRPQSDEIGSNPIQLDIDSLSILNVSLVYDDQQTKTYFSLTPFSLEGEGVNTDGQPFDLVLRLSATLDDTISVDGEYKTHASIQLSPINIALENNELQLVLSGKELPLPEHKIESRFDLVFNQEKLWLEPFELKLDNTTFNGKLGMDDLSQQNFYVSLDGDTLDLDQYASTDTAGEPSNKSNTEDQTDTAEESRVATENSEEPGGDEPLLPIETVKTLSFNFHLGLQKIIASGMVLEAFSVDARGNDGKLGITQLRGELYEGRLEASADVDVNPQQPLWTINKTIENVQLQPLLQDAADTGQIQGVANFTMQLTTEGNSINSLKQNLNGPLDFEIYKSRIDNVNLEKMVCQGVALVNKESLSNNWANHTEFTQMKGRVNFEDGEGEVSLQPMQLQNLKLDAEGEILLPKDYFNILLTMELNGDLSKRDKACRMNDAIDGAQWPVRCEGRFADDLDKACGLDKKGMAKILKRAARNAAMDKLKDKIKGFFGG